MLLEPWLQEKRIRGVALKNDLRTVEVDNRDKKYLEKCIDNYIFCGGHTIWRTEEIPQLQHIIKRLLGINKNDFSKCLELMDPNLLRELVRSKTYGIDDNQIECVCEILTKVEGENNGTV